MALLAPLLAAAPVQCVHECEKRTRLVLYATPKVFAFYKMYNIQSQSTEKSERDCTLRETETICVHFYFSSIFFFVLFAIASLKILLKSTVSVK